MRLKLASWNLHRCVGSDGIMSVQRCVAVLREIDADMVALQEVESRPGHADDLLEYLARATGSRAIGGATLLRDDAHYGNALLSRLPLSAVRRHDLSVPGREPRGAIDVDFSLQGVRAQLIVTHLGLRPAERRRQVQRLTRAFRKDAYELVIFAGDFNEWLLWGRPLRRLHRIFPQTPHRRTWPARAPLFALDRIWVHPAASMRKLYVYRSAVTRVASDHLPLVAEIDYPTSAG